MEMNVDFGLEYTSLTLTKENKQVSGQNIFGNLYDTVEAIITYASEGNVNKIKIDCVGLGLAVRDCLEREIQNRNLKITVCWLKL